MTLCPSTTFALLFHAIWFLEVGFSNLVCLQIIELCIPLYFCLHTGQFLPDLIFIL